MANSKISALTSATTPVAGTEVLPIVQSSATVKLAISDLTPGLSTITAAKGGTGQTSYAVGDLLYASATTTLSKLADVATGNALISGGVTTAPSWGKIGLTTHVSGTLPTANGGTNLTSFTANGVVYASSTSVLATGSGFVFDGSSVGIGTASPVTRLHVYNSTSGAPTTLTLNSVNGGGGTTGITFRPYQSDTQAAANPPQVAIYAVDSNYSANLTFNIKTPGAIGNAMFEAARFDTTGAIGLGTSSPNASAILDAQSTTRGVRFPNMTTVQKNAISSPAAGLVVFDTTLAKLCVYSGAAWQTITSI